MASCVKRRISFGLPLAGADNRRPDMAKKRRASYIDNPKTSSMPQKSHHSKSNDTLSNPFRPSTWLRKRNPCRPTSTHKGGWEPVSVAHADSATTSLEPSSEGHTNKDSRKESQNTPSSFQACSSTSQHDSHSSLNVPLPSSAKTTTASQQTHPSDSLVQNYPNSTVMESGMDGWGLESDGGLPPKSTAISAGKTDRSSKFGRYLTKNSKVSFENIHSKAPTVNRFSRIGNGKGVMSRVKSMFFQPTPENRVISSPQLLHTDNHDTPEQQHPDYPFSVPGQRRTSEGRNLAARKVKSLTGDGLIKRKPVPGKGTTDRANAKDLDGRRQTSHFDNTIFQNSLIKNLAELDEILAGEPSTTKPSITESPITKPSATENSTAQPSIAESSATEYSTVKPSIAEPLTSKASANATPTDELFFDVPSSFSQSAPPYPESKLTQDGPFYDVPLDTEPTYTELPLNNPQYDEAAHDEVSLHKSSPSCLSANAEEDAASPGDQPEVAVAPEEIKRPATPESIDTGYTNDISGLGHHPNVMEFATRPDHIPEESLPKPGGDPRWPFYYPSPIQEEPASQNITFVPTYSSRRNTFHFSLSSHNEIYQFLKRKILHRNKASKRATTRPNGIKADDNVADFDEGNMATPVTVCHQPENKHHSLAASFHYVKETEADKRASVESAFGTSSGQLKRSASEVVLFPEDAGENRGLVRSGSPSKKRRSASIRNSGCSSLHSLHEMLGFPRGLDSPTDLARLIASALPVPGQETGPLLSPYRMGRNRRAGWVGPDDFRFEEWKDYR